MSQSSQSHHSSLISWVSPVDAGALSRKMKTSRGCRAGVTNLIFSDTRKRSHGPKDQRAHQDPVGSGVTASGPSSRVSVRPLRLVVCRPGWTAKPGCNPGWHGPCKMFRAPSFHRHLWRQMSLKKWAAQCKTHVPAAFSFCFLAFCLWQQFEQLVKLTTSLFTLLWQTFWKSRFCF